MKNLLFLILICLNTSVFAQHTEYLDFTWQSEEDWSVAFEEEDDKMLILQYIPKGQTLETWREIGTIQMIKMAEIRQFTPYEMMEIMYKQGLQQAPEAKLTFITKNDSTEYPWIQFKIEAPKLKDIPQAESQLYHLIQGKETLFVVIWGIRRWEIYTEEESKWREIFSKATVGTD